MNFICEICGKEFNTQHWGKPFDKICSRECFSEKFWQDIIKEGGYYNFDGDSVFIKPYKKDGDSRILGCAGNIFYLQSIENPNKIFMTNDLWIQGQIPDKYLDKFEKVKQINKEEYERLKANENII